jgi:CRP-like cAMP-binding protein
VNPEELKRFAVLAECSDEDREAIAPLLEERQLRAGSPLFREGSESEALVLVAEGALRLESRRAGELGTLGPGGALGGVALVLAGKREVSAVAASPSRLWLLDRAAFRRLVADAPRAACRIAEGVLAQLAGALRDQLPRPASSS